MRLLLFLLKCVVGLLASVGLIVLLIGLGLGFAWREFAAWQQPERERPENAVLLLDLGKGLADGPPGGAVLAGLTDELNLRQLVLGLEAAANDPAVGGLVLEVGSGGLDVARTQELRQAIADFKRSGKPVQAFAASFGEGGDGTLHYYLASVADQVTLQPSGNLDLVGFTLDQPYARELLEDWGIEPRVYRREEYKGAAEPVLFREMSGPVRRNLQRLLDSWFEQLVGDIADSRALERREVRTTIDEGPYLPGEALNRGLVDRLGYRDEARSDALEAAGPRAELMPLQHYLTSLFEDAEQDDDRLPRIAVIYGLGPVVLGESEEGGTISGFTMGSDTVAEAFAEAAADPEVRAILFRVDSPGGSYSASDAVWRAVRQAREAGKPVVVSMGSMAASGGYFVAAAADRIIAAPGTVTGSIGVVSGKMLSRGLWEELGVNWSGVQAGANARFWDWGEDFTPAQWARFRNFIDVAYEDFVGKVASGRNLSFEDAEAVAGGRVWSGVDALERGLVDGLGGYRAGIDTAKTVAGIPITEPVRLVDYPDVEDRLQRMLRQFFLDSLLASRVAGLLRQSGLVEPLAEAGRHGASLTQDPRAGLLRALE